MPYAFAPPVVMSQLPLTTTDAAAAAVGAVLGAVERAAVAAAAAVAALAQRQDAARIVSAWCESLRLPVTMMVPPVPAGPPALAFLV